MQKNLTNGFSQFYRIVDILFLLFAIGLFIYSLFVGDRNLIVFCALFLLYNYFFFFRKLKSFKEIKFDGENIYFDQKAVSYKHITKIKFGKIEFSDSVEERFIRFMTIPFLNPLDELIANHEEAQINE